MHIRRDDTVEVIAGDDRSRAGERRLARVLHVYPKDGKVLVEGVNRVRKHLRKSQKHPQGGRLDKEMPIDASNVALYCSHCNRGVRVGLRYLDDGAKERYCKKCGHSLGKVSPARERYAGKE